MPAPHTLHARTLMSGTARHYWVKTEGLPLSLKCPLEGQARYLVERREFAVDAGGWLVVNEGQPYTIEIDSPTLVHTFVVWFPRGWAEEVWRSLTIPAARQLATGGRADGGPSSLHFSERYTCNESVLAPATHGLRARYLSGTPIEDGWLEEKLRGLLARMIAVQCEWKRVIAGLPAERAATRAELWHRLNRARDYIHARFDAPLSLTDAARCAAMSPYHFLRSFNAAFGLTPHAWLVQCRLAQAKRLLARTELPVTEVCLAVGYESLGSFSAWFQRMAGRSPRGWREEHGVRRAIRNIREVFP